MNTLQSPLHSCAAVKRASSFDLALNCCDANKLMSSTPAITARIATIILSNEVVVGPCKFSVSLMMAHRSMPVWEVEKNENKEGG